MRLGLCCAFRDQPIKFLNTTVTSLSRMSRESRLEKVAGLCRGNAEALRRAIEYCGEAGIGCFRINSQILPVKTHEGCGYAMEELPGGEEIIRLFRECGELARKKKVRLGFHPDQFVVLNSPRPEVVERSVRELEYQAEVAEWVGGDFVNIHGGGAYGNKETALGEFARNLERLSERARSRLTVENDDKVYTPRDLLPLCRSEGIPLVYDVHHHRCLGDGMNVEEATEATRKTWGKREPLFHISSPLEGWSGKQPERHHDFIDVADFPACWKGKRITVEVEAKAKEAAVLRLAEVLRLGRELKIEN